MASALSIYIQLTSCKFHIVSLKQQAESEASSLQTQVKPFLEQPDLQVQTNDPSVLWQMAFLSQIRTGGLHSSASKKKTTTTI